MIAPHELVRPALPESWSGCVTLADYSQLIPAEGKICRIRATELRGIRVAQLHSLLVFIKEMAPYWCETFGAEAGQALLFEKFNLYNANQWIIRPSAEGRGGHRIHLSKVMSQVEKGCSYVELVSMEAEAQRPHWFVSHAWKEPIVNFVSCLEKHLAVRGLSPESPYWVCAYANNQHTLDKEITEDPRETAFYRAMKASEGVLLILDKDATPFSRIWCCFEESVAVEERNSATPLLLDLAAVASFEAHMVTDGLAGVERQMMPLLGMLSKSQRESYFPAEVLEKGLQVDIRTAEAAVAEDKNRILMSIVKRRQSKNAIGMFSSSKSSRNSEVQLPPEEHESYDMVNRALAAQFSLASWFEFVMKGRSCQKLADALAADVSRTIVQLSMTGCFGFKDADLQALLRCLPEGLCVLRLDLAFTDLEAPFDDEHLKFPDLRQLMLRFGGSSLESIEGLPAILSRLTNLSSLELWLCNLPSLKRIGPLGHIIKRSQLKELVLQLVGCPQLSLPVKEELNRCLRYVLLWLRVKQHVQIEDVSHSWQCPRRNEVQVQHPGNPCEEYEEISGLMPYPCSYPGCKEFHQNHQGFCRRHRRQGFLWKMRSSLQTVRQGAELALLLSTQAFLESNSRITLALLGLSLYPVTYTMVANSTGIFAGVVVSIALMLVFASLAYTSARFDWMRSSMLKLSLATEASYFQVLQDASGPVAALSTVFEELGELDKLQQDPDLVSDLKSSFVEAGRRRGVFQKWICDYFSDIEGSVKAKLKLPTEVFGVVQAQGAPSLVDLLYCEVHCRGMRSVQRAWHCLKEIVATCDADGAEEPRKLRLAAVRDDFVVFRGRRCGRAVLSIDGYLATVIFLEMNLARLDEELGDTCHMAESIGLLEDVKPQNWEVVSTSKVTRSSWLQWGCLFLLRLLAAGFAGYFGAGYYVFGGLVFSLPFFVVGLALGRDLFPRQTQDDTSSSRLVYEKYLGMQAGHYYVLKVTILQFATVGLQAVGKLEAFGAAVIESRTNSANSALLELGYLSLDVYTDCYWIFVSLLMVNCIYPSILLCFPSARWARVGAGFMDILLDLGYLGTFIFLFFPIPSGSRLQFPMEFLGYMASYTNIVRMFGVCRSLEATSEATKTPARASELQAKQRILKRFAPWHLTLSSLLVLAVVLSNEDVYPMWIPSAGERCLPCRCITRPEVHLKSCNFLRLTDETDLTFESRQIKSIAPEALSRLTSLQSISFKNNELTSLPSGLLNGLTSLGYIELNNNQLISLPSDLFDGCTSLRYISLNNNQLTSLPSDLFHGLTSLEGISLNNNQLTSLPSDLFHGLTSLRDIYLNHNQLTSLPSDLFHELTSLNQIDLSYNQLVSVAQELCEVRKFVNLSYNHISSLPEVCDGLPHVLWEPNNGEVESP
ncbi:unnamed protein product [Durusdinium trenchii]|uniref:Uncharacterized protein n=1 Tax=Durusdinium trenchii TaxID=1381693 RepID=A0ABP0S2F2_9DINO